MAGQAKKFLSVPRDLSAKPELDENLLYINLSYFDQENAKDMVRQNYESCIKKQQLTNEDLDMITSAIERVWSKIGSNSLK